MNNTREELLGMIEAAEQRYANDTARLQQLADLKRRIDEEIEGTGFPPPKNIIETLLSMIAEGRLPTGQEFSEALARAVEAELVEARAGAIGRDPEFDFNFRPESFWDFDMGRPHRGTSRIDIPYWMPGEYLPDYAEGEVEIARVELRSTTGDVLSVRARRGKKFITYRVVDEYEMRYKTHPSRSLLPLTMGELINLMDHVQTEDGDYFSLAIPNPENQLKYLDDPERYVGFIQVWSAFYPQLGAYYDRKIEQVLAEWRKKLKADRGDK